MTIQTTVLTEHQLTIHTVQGKLELAEIMATLRTFFANEPTAHVLWDLRQAILTNLTADQVRTFVEFAAQRNIVRKGGRTAFLISERLGDYGMARMIEILGNMLGPNVAGVLFQDYEEARQWLRGE